MLVEVQPTRSLQEIIKRRQQHDFVGRERQVNGFRENLTLSLDDERRRFIFNVSGPGGVGKTWLLRRFNTIAQQAGMLTAWTDDAESDVVSVMEHIAARIEAQGRPMTIFTDGLRSFRRNSSGHQFVGAPGAQRPTPLDNTLIKGTTATRCVPLDGPTRGFSDRNVPNVCPPRGRVDALSDKEVAWPDALVPAPWLGPVDAEDPPSESHHAEHHRAEDHRIVVDPIRVLSSTFVRALRAVGQETPIALFFDAYERTSGFLDEWLRTILEGGFGDLPASTIIGIAGQEKLDAVRWGGFESVVAQVPLEDFTHDEARTFLARKGITDNRVVGNVLRISGRSPVLLATLALARSGFLESIPDTADGDEEDAIGCYLASLDDPLRRSALLDAAQARRLDADLLAYLIDRPEAGQLVDWLRNLPFVEKHAGTWTYRQAVRDSLLRHRRRQSPERWTELHGRLGTYYERLRDALGHDVTNRYRDSRWQGYALEALYHRLCESPRGFLARALGGFVPTFGDEQTLARRWAETIVQAGQDSGDDELRGWGNRLLEGLQAYTEGRYESVVSSLNGLLESPDLDERSRPEALAMRGRLLFAAGRVDVALRVYADLVQVAPEVATYWIEKGIALARLGYYQKAVEDFNRALEIAPRDVRALANRGEAYRLLESYDHALSDFGSALDMEPDNASVLGSRAQAYLALERFDDALADLNRALDLAPDETWILAERGSTYRSLGRYEQALEDLNRVLRREPNNVWALAVRGDVYWQLQRYDAARADFNRALDVQVRSA